MYIGATIETPLGPIRLVADEDALLGVYLPGQRALDAEERERPILEQAARELREYFAGTRSTFEVPLRPSGTPFQSAVWSALRTIPFGATWTYTELARAIDRPSAVRAVGGANAKNPLSIVVPCHRVIGARGDLVGYAGGPDAKRWLLDHEARA